MWALTAFPGIALAIPVLIFVLANLLLRKPLCPPKTTALIAVILGIVDFHAFQIMFFSPSLAQWTIPDNEDRLSSVVYMRLAIEVVLSLLLYYGAHFLYRRSNKRSDDAS
ncbi:hypothetical protein TH25_14660 [Thalassospira profundimaris]|uniref:Uncharacterized protein n=2 Tax=Thalassospira profundimaris TaxID=502049 RepID=A0A367X6I3_9PROT|nr:hypothetical protein TH25_14660 [Thalassospira profundimaris]